MYLKLYKEHISSTVNVSFYVLGDGSLADVKVITICPQEMKEEVLRLVKAMPKWKTSLKRRQADMCENYDTNRYYAKVTYATIRSTIDRN